MKKYYFLFLTMVTGLAFAQVPMLNTPADNATINGISTPLDWLDVVGESGYIYQIDITNTFDSPRAITLTIGAFSGSGYPTIYLSNLSFGTTYYWRVATQNGTSQSAWSGTRRFTTITRPTLSYPINRGRLNSFFTTLNWNDVSGETGYIYQYDIVDTFDSEDLVTRTTGEHTSNSSLPEGLADNLYFDTTYYWRVAIVNGVSQSEWSDVRTFSSVGPPFLEYPHYGQVIYHTMTSLSWRDIVGETGYIYQYDTVNTFNSPNLITGTTEPHDLPTSPGVIITDLAYNTSYYWRVAILNGNIQSDWSDLRYFTTVDTANNKDVTANAYSIYPTHVKDVLHFNNVPNNANITINSIDGKLVLSSKANNNSPLNLNNLTAGVYLITIEKDGQKTVQKFIKQ